jgi:hypothetical protein
MVKPLILDELHAVLAAVPRAQEAAGFIWQVAAIDGLCLRNNR